MRWSLSWRADPKARAIADRHYNRQSVGAAQFVPPGRCLVLTCESALWITSWPFAEYVKHAWAGAWVWRWPGVPSVGAREIRRRHDRTDIERIRIAIPGGVLCRTCHGIGSAGSRLIAGAWMRCARERVWFSPACLNHDEKPRQGDLFAPRPA